MTLVADIINDAFRQGNLIAVGGSATQPQIDEALRYLNRIVLSTLGAEVGDPLTALPLGRQNISRPSGFPYWGQAPGTEWFVRKNTRLMLNLEAPLEIFLHPMPNAGTRFSVKDVAGNLSSNIVTINGNGRLIEGAQTLTLDTDSFNADWFYRDDLASWVRVSPLTETDEFPFPEEYDDFFITMLAIRLNPAYGVSLDAQSDLALNRARTQLRARYKQNVPVLPQAGTWMLSRNTRNETFGHDDFDQPGLGDNPGRGWYGW